MPPKPLHFCSYHQPIVNRFVAMRDRLDISDPESYINHTLMLALLGLMHNNVSQLSFKRGWGYHSFFDEDRFIDWLLKDSPSLARIIKVGLSLKLESIEEYIISPNYPKMLEYLRKDFIKELTSFVENDKYSIFLRLFILSHSQLTFLESGLLAKQSYYISKILNLFYIKYPILLMHNCRGYLPDVGRKIDYDKLAKSSIEYSIKDYYSLNFEQRFEQLSIEFMNRTLGLIGDKRIGANYPLQKTLDTEYYFDSDFF